MASMVAYLKKHQLGDAGAAFNYHVFDGGEAGLEKVLQQALSFPLMCDRQLIWLKRADEAISGQDLEDGFLRYLADPSPQTTLVMTAVKLDGRRKWVKEFKSAGGYFTFAPPAGAELVKWVQRTARNQGLELDDDLAGLLIELIGDDLNALSGEINKLALMTEDAGTALDGDRLRAVIISQRSVDIFELVKNLGPGRSSTGLRAFHKFITEGRSPYELAPLLAWRIKQISMVSALLGEGLDDREIMRRAGLSPYAYRAVAAAARSWGPDGARRALAACADCDAAVKGSPLGPEYVLERAILAICQ